MLMLSEKSAGMKVDGTAEGTGAGGEGEGWVGDGGGGDAGEGEGDGGGGDGYTIKGGDEGEGLGGPGDAAGARRSGGDGGGRQCEYALQPRDTAGNGSQLSRKAAQPSQAAGTRDGSGLRNPR